MLLLKLALLNIGRNPRRSVITILAIGVGLAALIFLWGFTDGNLEQMRENVIRLLTGHVQIQRQGFDESLSPELTLPDAEGIIKKIEAHPSLVAYSKRAQSEALIGTSERSRGVIMTGIDPGQEPKVTDLNDHVLEGRFLTSEDTRGVLIGDRLAKKLRVELNDKVVVMSQAIDGTLAGYAYRVQGIFHTGSRAVDESSIYLTLASVQELLGLEQDFHSIMVRLKDRDELKTFLPYLHESISNKTDLSILPWNELIPEVEQWAEWSSSINQTILTAIMIVIAVSIMNTMLMAVFERTRELGIMIAIGTSPARVVKLILLETLFLEAAGIAVGLVMGYSVVNHFGKVGIHFAHLEKAFSMSYMSTTVYTQVEPVHVVQSVLSLLLITSCIGLYPAFRAARMEPVKAIYHSN